ncbi:additional substrate-specific component CbiN of cobalt ECF transporter [Aquitalea magnusonii]|jgi:cobalt/nickel transport protein|uniref:Cobalt transport protein CbiN n=1 Tax=Aquitalea magnusonii TaxID=332411 RepID=A0A3G9G7R0_9NEIS|nr:energy-coupling factor ABC transporter substrate-binding protein [Aquitalea magnusonii]BBF84068.1 additional substrate-specific component CbiN of cobalt ECF transporter [Aquitalea magnusonii]
MSKPSRSKWLLLGTVALVVLPLVIGGGKFTGSDDQASEAIAHAQPGYKPWFEPLWEPPSGEVESLLFALQAAIGAGVIGYVIGKRQGLAARHEDKH